MKKILLIILSILSIITYATDENTENQIGEKLKVDVKFTLPKEIIKYVVYAEKGGVIEDKLILPDFVMSQDVTKAGFVEVPPKVYVKRVVNGKMENLSSTEKVTYVLNHVDGFMMPSSVPNDTIAEGSISYRQITSYLAKSTLEDVIKNSGIKGYIINERGSIVRAGTSPLEVYSPGAQINMTNTGGVLETTSPKNSYPYSSIPTEDIQKIEAYIGSGKPLGNASLKVIVN